MADLQLIISEQVDKIGQAYQTLLEIMPDYFFRSFADRIGKILPFICNLDQQSGIRRAEFNGEVFFVYLLSETNNPAVTSRMMDGEHLLNASIHRSEKTFLVGDKPATLMIEHYTLDQGDAVEPRYTLQELQEAYNEQFGSGQDDEIEELYSRLNFNVFQDLGSERLAERVHWVLKAQGNDHILTEISEWNQENLRLTVAWPIPASNRDFCSQLLEVILSHGLELRRCYFREMSHNNDEVAFNKLPVILVTAYLNQDPEEGITSERLNALLADIRLLGWVEMYDLLHTELVKRQKFSLASVNWIRSAAEFIHGQLAYVDRSVYNHRDITRYLAVYSNYASELFYEFKKRFNPAEESYPDFEEKMDFHRRFCEKIEKINTGNQEKNIVVKTIFRSCLNFLDCILKCNFYSQDKAALAYRLNPDFCNFYSELSKDYAASFAATPPFGVFFFYRRQTLGYHVRFTDIARGGWRSVLPGRSGSRLEMNDNYEFACDEAFRECYVLAHTQHLKNKDIYEGGAKMLTLLEPIDRSSELKQILWQSQRAITSAFLSLINYDENKKLRDKNIVDLFGSREIIEIGPDENMYDPMIAWIGAYAARSGYTLGSGLISGKPEGGINHKEYGVTSFGIHQYLMKTLCELKIDPYQDDFSIKIAGGPSGDVAGNAIKLLLEEKDGKALYPGLKIIAITDGPAIAYDPEGLDQQELRGMIHKEAMDGFDPQKLKGEGALMVFSKAISIDEKNYHKKYIIHNGKLEERLLGRDEFMQLFQNNLTHYADIFLPGGGRPATINKANWQNYFSADNKASFKAIVEGANAFISSEARNKLQENGVWIIKDASANKCGVITSSYEILSGLMLDEKEFEEVKPELVEQVMQILSRLANQEAKWLFDRFRQQGTFLTELTEKLSRDINAAKQEIFNFLADNPEFITDELLLSPLPPLFRERYAERCRRLPEEYQRALVAVELACRLVYSESDIDLKSRLLTVMNDTEKKALATKE